MINIILIAAFISSVFTSELLLGPHLPPQLHISKLNDSATLKTGIFHEDCGM